ncbi:unnamed protein product [Diatraea saccharalis]|uniref:DNA polymerase eta n=1 Tax=Diatraea saccharalis TaxID=40085 RepID=A0A9N9W7I3_9NEOP|nr:unnamed protein product [Diatraea saccharalis]
MDNDNRVVVLIDMDCFYCQVEEKLNPELKGKPLAVVQYNPWKGGGIIAVNYVARAMGVSRHMRGDEAKEKCPDIILPSVPCLRGKADITKYRDAGKEVAKVLQRFTPLLERASIDEAYMDITEPVRERLKLLNVNSVNKNMVPDTFALGYESIGEFIIDVHNYGSDSIEFDYEHAKQLLVGAVIVSEIRAAVYEETGYKCSAGIAHNKILAKLVCGMNKPDKQTILPKHSINILYSTLSIKKVKHLGGKFGDTVCDTLKIRNMIQLQDFTQKELQVRFDEKNGTWLYNIARGIDLEPVQARFNPKSIGCCKQLRGKSALTDLDSLKKWLIDLGQEIEDRLEKDAVENNRTPKQMVVSFSTNSADGRDISSSRSYNFANDDDLCSDLFSSKALELVMETAEGVKLQGDEKNRQLKAPIKFLGISVGKFEDNTDSKRTKKIVDYFAAGTSLKVKDTESSDDRVSHVVNNNQHKEGKEYVLQKFFKNTLNKQENLKKTLLIDGTNEAIVETSLEKQESFFAKLLNSTNNKKLNENIVKPFPVSAPDKKQEIINPSTAVCDVLDCGENSNDTAYSTSTINEEINKSIALFEDDPEDLNRISNMRQLLNSTIIQDENETISEKSSEDNDKSIGSSNVDHKNSLESMNNVSNLKEVCSSESNPVCESNIDTFQCPECKKAVKMDELDTHADYHLAIKLRDEERLQARKGKKTIKSIKKNEETKKRILAPEVLPGKSEGSIASFLVKIDNTVPTKTCTECGKRVPNGKLAEHLDFHEAQKLNRELNKKTVAAFPSYSIGKRKRVTVSPVKKPNKVPCKSINSYFG